MSTDLTAPTVDYGTLERLAKACAASGYFKDATDEAKAYVKVVAGHELGIGPVQALTGIHIVQGKPTLSAALVGALIKRSGRYDYRVSHLDDETCTLIFYEGGEKVGDSTFSKTDAEQAGLTKNPVWKTFPRNMLLSRALTNGARWYCPDVFGGAVYTPDELGAQVEFDGDGEIVAVAESVPAEDSVAEVSSILAVPGRSESVGGNSIATINESSYREVVNFAKQHGVVWEEIATEVLGRDLLGPQDLSVTVDEAKQVCAEIVERAKAAA